MQEKDQDLLEAYYNKYRNSEDKNPNYLTSKELNRIVKPNSKDHDIYSCRIEKQNICSPEPIPKPTMT